MAPEPGQRFVRFVGDRLRVELDVPETRGMRAFLRTNITRASVAREEIIAGTGPRRWGEAPFAGASWRDIPMREDGGHFTLELPLLEVGYFRAKAYVRDVNGVQRWPSGDDLGISVHPDALRTGNTIYCAYARAFGDARRDLPRDAAAAAAGLEGRGFTVIPPSGTLRDLTRAIPHVMDVLGFRAIQLMPIGPVPTTHARMGTFGSPYAELDLTDIDPALIEHDRRTTAVDQFRELADAIHARSGLVLLDVVLNHTGWCSRLLSLHPEWFLKNPDGTFKSPGAWGVTWGDLVELDLRHVELWQVLADSLVTWCRRGVDGFRCDAGYMVPVSAWQLVIARVRSEFPDCVFFLEGLGGSWEATEALLTEGGMQWAYSELFQNHSGVEVAGYLDHALRQSERAGLLVHYSETHDNERLAARGRTWSLLRNRLCALASRSGGYAITGGVEWLAREKIDVHEARSLAFGRTPNLISEIARLNRLLSEHPCFFEGATVTRLSPPASSILCLERRSPRGPELCLVLVNLDPGSPHSIDLEAPAWPPGGSPGVDLLGGRVPEADRLDDGRFRVQLGAGESVCLTPARTAVEMDGGTYRRRRAQAAWALGALSHVLAHERIGDADFEELANLVEEDPVAFLGSLAHLDRALSGENLLAALRAACEKLGYAAVVTWTALDARRTVLVPPGHFLLVVDRERFEVDLESSKVPRRQVAVPTRLGHVVAIPPLGGEERDVVLRFDRYGDGATPTESTIRVVGSWGSPSTRFLEQSDRILLTNGRGAMARVPLDLGSVLGKYDCLLGANLHPDVPSDRHVLVKRIRLWASSDGFITPLDSKNALDVAPGPPARWRFAAQAGDGRRVRIDVELAMVPGENTVLLCVSRPGKDPLDTLPPDRDVRVTVRLDLEDRSYHEETRFTPEIDARFAAALTSLETRAGFRFRPAEDRGLSAVLEPGVFHSEPEWSRGLFHAEEASRGLADRGDAWSPGWFDAELRAGGSLLLEVSAEPGRLSALAAGAPLRSMNAATRPASVPGPARGGGGGAEDPFVRTLRSALDAFIVRRGRATTVIAGYPWFLDWGRDALIATRGLVAAGRVEEALSVLRAFGNFERGGSLPNFLVGETAGSRESSDAPLWFALACDDLARVRGDGVLAERTEGGRTLTEVLHSIAMNYLEGTEMGVRVDAESALVWSPAHFTWMDTNHPAATPREGYPVELGVLFARLAALLHRLGRRPEQGTFAEISARSRASLSLYEHPGRGFLSDTLHAPAGVPARHARADDHLRPNQLFAVSLGLVEGPLAQAIVSTAARHLLVPGALRTLAPLGVEEPLPVAIGNRSLNDPHFPYWGRYEGDEDTRRKPAYHNGTAWPWLLPTFSEALVRAWPGDALALHAARAILGSSAALLTRGTAGQLPEIVDGDAPHDPRGCDAQAWSVTETLRVALLLSPREGRS